MSEHEPLEIRCFVTEPWESVYMLFMLPGLIIWIVGVVWCLRNRNIRGSVIVQVVGAIEVVVGAGTALVVGMTDIAHGIEASGAFQPLMFIDDSRYMAQVSLIGLLVHLALLLITLVLVVYVIRESKKHNKPWDATGDNAPR